MTRYTHEAIVHQTFPKSPSNATNCIVGLMNRNKTSKIIGDRQPGLDHTWAIHISHDVMSMIIGRDLGHNYPDAIKNPAIEQYFERVTNRLDVLGMSLYYGKRCWVCVRGSHSAGEGIAQDLIYNVDDFFNEAPHSETGV